MDEQVECKRPEFPQSKCADKKTCKLWDLMQLYIKNDSDTIQKSIVNHVEYTLAKTRFSFSDFNAYQATSCSIRDRLIESLNDTNEYQFSKKVKRLSYLSIEYLPGRLMQNSLINIDMEEKYKAALMEIGFDLEALYAEEVEPALGNGGLGRLAACFLDSLTSMNMPAWGYGLRYDYGIFKQRFSPDGEQMEMPDYWLSKGNPWEIERQDIYYPIMFYGHV